MESWKDNFPKEKRYFETKNGILYCGDCLEILKRISDKSIDLILTDPPYGIGADKGVGWGGCAPPRHYKDEWDTRLESSYFVELLRVGKHAMVFGGNFYTDMLPQSNHWVVWDKIGGMFSQKRSISDAELIYTTFKKNSVRKFIVIQQGFIAEERERFHPTQKPVKLIKMILIEYSNENDVICDPFLGSGTTAIACEKLNRHWIGIEKEEKYCEIAKIRIEEELKKPRLFR